MKYHAGKRKKRLLTLADGGSGAPAEILTIQIYNQIGVKLSTYSAERGATPLMSALRIIQPDDWHVHLRDGAMLAAVLPHTARQFARAIVMPNLPVAVTTTAQALAYRERILLTYQSIKTATSKEFTPLMTLYLTDNTTADEIVRAYESQLITAVKLYPAGATTNSASGVTDLSRCSAALEAMQKVGMPLLVHGEVTDTAIDIFDREKIFIDTVLEKLRRDYPALKIVFEHITTTNAVDYVRQADARYAPIAATITAHHLLFNRNSLLVGGVRPHYYCLPVLKREVHRQALLAAATSGNPRFFLGTDTAPHTKNAKESACGCAGCYTAFHALELYAHAFEQANALDKLEGFASFYGADFYQLPRNTDFLTLKREEWQIPHNLPAGDEEIVPLWAGHTLAWKCLV